MIRIVSITKDEAAFMRKQKRVNCFIPRKTTHGKYFLTEEAAALRLLEAYRAGELKSGGVRNGY